MVSKDGFGLLLRNLRRSHGITQGQLANKAYLSQSYISGLEAGVRRPPTQKHVEILADALNLDVESRRELFEAAGFVPIEGSKRKVSGVNASYNPSTGDSPSEYRDIERVVNKLLFFSDERDVVVKDLLERIDSWVLYQQASVAALSDKNFTRYVCQLIASAERRSALMTKVASLYVKSKETT